MSYSGSPSDNFEPPLWTPLQKHFDYNEFPTSMEATTSSTCFLPLPPENRFASGLSAVSNSFQFPSSLSESGQCVSTSRQPVSLPPHHTSSRLSCLSKPVYPLVFQNPISDGEAFMSEDTNLTNRLTPRENTTSSHCPKISSHIDHKFHKTLIELQMMEDSPDFSLSSRRDGFRWSNVSSHDLGFDRDSFDVPEHVELETRRSPKCVVEDQKCVLCGRLLSQKSPWSSYRIFRGGNLPITGILSCSHVFHAECLEQTTSKADSSDPACPTCLNTIDAAEESVSVSAPLEIALRSIRKNRGLVISDEPRNNGSTKCLDNIEGSSRRNLTLSVSQPNANGSSIRSHLKKNLFFKGNSGKNFLGAKLLRRIGSASSSQDPAGCSRPMKSRKNSR